MVELTNALGVLTRPSVYPGEYFFSYPQNIALIKDYSENKGLVDSLVENGIVSYAYDTKEESTTNIGPFDATLVSVIFD